LLVNLRDQKIDREDYSHDSLCHMCYNVPLHVSMTGRVLLQYIDCQSSV